MKSGVVAAPGSAGGIFLTSKVFPGLGVADRINVKVTERGSQPAGMVTSGGSRLAFQPVSELVKVPGIDYVGRVPDELQLVQVFAAAVVKDAKNPVAEGLLIQLLTSGHLRGLIAHTGQT